MEGEKRRKSPESIKLEGKRKKGPEEKGPLTSFASYLQRMLNMNFLDRILFCLKAFTYSM